MDNYIKINNDDLVKAKPISAANFLRLANWAMSHNAGWYNYAKTLLSTNALIEDYENGKDEGINVHETFKVIIGQLISYIGKQSAVDLNYLLVKIGNPYVQIEFMNTLRAYQIHNKLMNMMGNWDFDDERYTVNYTQAIPLSDTVISNLVIKIDTDRLMIYTEAESMPYFLIKLEGSSLKMYLTKDRVDTPDKLFKYYLLCINTMTEFLSLLPDDKVYLQKYMTSDPGTLIKFSDSIIVGNWKEIELK